MRRLPSFFALRAFEAAARHGSFTEAGRELKLTPSAISHQVRALEDWFERPLFTRGVRQVTLTEDGRHLLAGLGPAFDQIEDACGRLRHRADGHELAVHCAPSFASKWLGPRLPQFMATHAAITIRLSSSAEPADLRKDKHLDVDITYGAPPRRAGIVVEPLGRERTAPLCRPDLLAAWAPASADDLARHTLIESQLNPVRWADWFQLNGGRPPDKAGPSFDRGALAIAAAVDGLGIALETTRFAQTELERGDLAIIDGPGFRPIERETHFICYRQGDRDNPPLLAFRGWLAQQLRQ